MQITEVDRAYENLAKSGKGYGMSGRGMSYPVPVVEGHVYFWMMQHRAECRRTLNHFALCKNEPFARWLTSDDIGGRMGHGGHRHFESSRGSQGSNLHNFYASQRHQPSRGSNEAEQVMQAKRRMAAQRERELRNLHTEQQYQRSRPPSTV